MCWHKKFVGVGGTNNMETDTNMVETSHIPSLLLDSETAPVLTIKSNGVTKVKNDCVQINSIVENETCEHCGSPIYNFTIVLGGDFRTNADNTKTGKRCMNVDCKMMSVYLHSKLFISMVRKYGVKVGSVFPLTK